MYDVRRGRNLIISRKINLFLRQIVHQVRVHTNLNVILFTTKINYQFYV